MKVLLLNPPFLPRYSRQSRSPCVTKGGTFYYPYYLAYAAGVLDKAGFEIKLVDAVAKNLSHKQTLEIVKKFNPALVVIDTSTPSIYNDVKIATKIKEQLGIGTHINLVGTHPTALPNETLKLGKGKVDSICKGEYDYTIRDLALALKNKKPLSSIKGLSYKKSKKIVHNPTRELIKNLDELPFVSAVYKKHLNIRDYFYASVRYPEVTILTARGCPYRCGFCNIPFKGSYRARSPENVVKEFEYIQKKLPEVKEVMIEDDTFAIDEERTLKLCNLMIKRGIRLPWSCNARVNMSLPLLKKMKEAGCRLLCVGFESPVQAILNKIPKGITKEQQLEFMRNTRKVGLLVNGCFILGLPEDTKETIKATIEFAKELNSDTAQFYPIMVYPGTAMYEWAKKNKYLETEDFSKWITSEGLHTTTVSRPDLSAKELVEICDKARKEFYLRPRYIFYKLKQIITRPQEFIRTLKALRIFFKYLFRGSKIK